MTRWNGAIPTVVALGVVAAVLFVPADPVRADLLGGLTETVDETTETTESTLDGVVDDGTNLIDDTAGSTGTVLDEPVDDLTDTVDDVAGTILPEDDPVTTTTTTTTPTTTTTTTPATTTTTTTTTTLASGGGGTDTGHDPPPPTADPEPTDDPTTDLTDDDREAIAGGGGTGRSDDSGDDRTADDRTFRAESLTVLAAAGGLTDSVTLRPVAVSPAFDSSLYGRLLEWLTSAGSGMGALLAGPLLALEIVIRALLSAGSGLVAPISLLGTYLTHLIWESRSIRRFAPPAEAFS